MENPGGMGEKYTICDPYLFTIASWIEGDGVDTAKLPRVMEHRKRMLARPAVQKAVAAEGTQISQIKGLYRRFRARLMAAVASARSDNRHRDLGETVDALGRAAEQLGLFVGRVAS